MVRAVHRAACVGVVVAGVSCAAPSRGQIFFGDVISDPALLNTNAMTDSGHDYAPQIKSDGGELWLSIWRSNEEVQPGIGTDHDLLMSRSIDLGRTWSHPRAINTDAVGDAFVDRGPQYVTDGVGNWVLVWHALDKNDPESSYDSYASYSSDQGTTWSPRHRLNVGGVNNAVDASTKPQVATDKQGVWISVWHSAETYGGRYGDDIDMFIARSEDNGRNWTSCVALNSNADSDEIDDVHAQICTDDNGVWVVIWHTVTPGASQFGDDSDIYFVRSEDHGRTWTDPAPLNTNAGHDSGDDGYAHLMNDGRGTWVAVWHSTTNLGGQIGSDPDILVSRSADNGASWSPPRPIDINASVDRGEDRFAYGHTDTHGNWVITWRSNDSLGGTIGGNYDVLISRSRDDGVTWTIPTALNTNANTNRGHNHYPHIAANGRGDWLGVWRSTDNPGGRLGDDWDVFVASFMLPPMGISYELTTSPLVGGQMCFFYVRGAEPESEQFLFYSFKGLGSTYIPRLGVAIDLDGATLAAAAMSDPAGRVRWTRFVPPNASQRRIWMQVGQHLMVANVVEEVIQ